MNKRIALLLSLIFVGAIAVFFLLSASKDQDKPTEDEAFRIGALLPLTGGAAAYGENARDGIALAVEKINISGGVLGRPVEIVVEDSQGEPRPALSAFQKLISFDNVFLVIGDITSSATLAISAVANREKVLVISPGASSPNITEAGSYVFRTWPSDVLEAATMAKYAQHQGFKTVSILHINNDYGVAFAKEFVRRFAGSPLYSVPSTEAFEQGSVDFRAHLTKIRADQPDALYLVSFPESTIPLLDQASELGLTMPIISTNAIEDPSVLENKRAEGIVFTTPLKPEATDPKVAEFQRSYRERFGREPGIVADTAYDAVNMACKAVANAGEFTGSAIREELLQLKDYHGASGTMTFDSNGDVEKPVGLKKIQSGAFVWLEEEH